MHIFWEASNEHTGVEVIYTVTMLPQSVTIPPITELSLTNSFLYNYEQEVLISAENCNGMSENTSISFTEGECIVILYL